MADNLTRPKPTDLTTRSSKTWWSDRRLCAALAGRRRSSREAAAPSARDLWARCDRFPAGNVGYGIAPDERDGPRGSRADQQLVYYRSTDERRVSPWFQNTVQLANAMTKITCRAGITQIARILTHCRNETTKHPVSALVFVGDAFEENVDELAPMAGELGRLGVKAFMFQEGDEPNVKAAFREIARLTEGAYCPFDAGAPQQLRELLGAVAAYAKGGLTDLGTARCSAFAVVF